MSAITKIEWCDSTFNPVIGCTKISPACDRCYAEVSTPARAMKITWGAGQARHRTAPSTWAQPLAWNKAHDKFFAAHGRRRRVFCASLADVFDNQWDPQWRADLFELIESTPNLDWLLLTKRIGNVSTMLADTLLRMPDLDTRNDQQWPWPNVWIGATIANQEEADRDIPKLLAVPARMRFLSMEPLLGPVDLMPHLLQCCGCPDEGHPGNYWEPPEPPSCCGNPEPTGLHWVIAGGESGPGARPSHPDWYRSLRNQCATGGVPFLFKQWGEWANCETAGLGLNWCYDSSKSGGWVETTGSFSEGENASPCFEGAEHVFKVGKKAAGRLLDGVEHNGFPL